MRERERERERENVHRLRMFAQGRLYEMKTVINFYYQVT